MEVGRPNTFLCPGAFRSNSEKDKCKSLSEDNLIRPVLYPEVFFFVGGGGGGGGGGGWNPNIKFPP